MRRAHLLCLPALLGACATTARPPPPPTAEAELIREALARPRLASCDELTCGYHQLRYFNVRAVQCVPVQGEPWEVVACSYERQRLSGHWRPEAAPDGGPGKPPRVRGPWRRARSSFIVYGEDSWALHDDPYRGGRSE